MKTNVPSLEKRPPRRGVKKNNVTLREKPLVNDNISLYLDIYRDGVRSYEFLKLYINDKARTPIERQRNKENLELAEKIRTQRESDLNHSAFGIISPAKQKVLFIDYTEAYIKDYNKKDIRMIKASIDRFKSFMKEDYPTIKLNTLKLSQIDKLMIKGYAEYLQDNSIGEGANSYLKRFKKVLKYAVDTEIISKSPANGITCTIDDSLKKDILSNDEIKILAKTACQNSNIKRAFIFSLCTGLRFCDIKALTYKEIDFSTGKMKVDQLKTGKMANIDLNNTAKNILGEPGKPEDLVFILPTYWGCNKTLDAWVKRAGINKHITWHCARHSFAVNMLTSKNKPDIKTVSSTLGHSTLKYTERYTRVVDKLKKAAVNALPDYDL